MVRTSILFVGYACAAETGSLMQSHNADLGGAGDVSFRLSKLADLQLTTKRMETEYKSMANAIINKEIDPKTGRPYEAPNRGDNMWEVVESQFDLLLWQLEEERKVNQKLVDDANHRVTGCNNARNAAYSAADGVDAKLSASDGERTAHAACRGEENTAIVERKDSCGRFVNQALCDAHKGDYNYFTKATPGDYQSVPEELLHAIAEASECKGELSVEVAKSADCDEAQDKFELAFCEYDQVLTQTCNTLDSCYEAAIADRTAIVDGVTELETNQKVVYKMVQKVRCYVEAMKTKFKTLKTSDIQHCEDMGLDASTLTITKPKPDPKAPCDKKLLQWGAPGADSWATKEYDHSPFTDHHGETYHGTKEVISKIEAIVSCNDLLA